MSSPSPSKPFVDAWEQTIALFQGDSDWSFEPNNINNDSNAPNPFLQPEAYQFDNAWDKVDEVVLPAFEKLGKFFENTTENIVQTAKDIIDFFETYGIWILGGIGVLIILFFVVKAIAFIKLMK